MGETRTAWVGRYRRAGISRKSPVWVADEACGLEIRKRDPARCCGLLGAWGTGRSRLRGIGRHTATRGQDHQTKKAGDQPHISTTQPPHGLLQAPVGGKAGERSNLRQALPVLVEVDRAAAKQDAVGVAYTEAAGGALDTAGSVPGVGLKI